MKEIKTSKKNKYNILFSKYDKNNDDYLTQREIILLMNKEFKLFYEKSIIISLMNIWGTKIKKKYYISRGIFIKMFKGPNGFFREIKL